MSKALDLVHIVHKLLKIQLCIIFLSLLTHLSTMLGLL